jgi:hypothetical protein
MARSVFGGGGHGSSVPQHCELWQETANRIERHACPGSVGSQNIAKHRKREAETVVEEDWSSCTKPWNLHFILHAPGVGRKMSSDRNMLSLRFL